MSRVRIGRIVGIGIALQVVVALHFVAGCAVHTGPRVSYYCNTMPLGLVYADSASRTRYLFRDVVGDMELSPEGRLAVVRDERLIDIYLGAKLLRRVRTDYIDPILLGWLGPRLVYQESGRGSPDFYADTHTYDVRNGRKKRLGTDASLRRVLTTPQGYVLFRVANGRLTITLLDPRRMRRRHQWSIAAEGMGDVIAIGRYLVVESTVSPGRRALCVVDMIGKSRRSVRVWDRVVGFCPGSSQHELIFGNPGPTGGEEYGYTQVQSLDLRTLRRRTLLRHRPWAIVEGLSGDRQWLLMNQPYADVGPGRLVAVRLSDSKVHTLRENVYECVVAPTEQLGH